MSSSVDNDNFIDDLDDPLYDASPASLTRIDSAETIPSVNLDTLRQCMLQALSATSSTCLKDKALSDSLPLATKLLIESIGETENSLSRDDANQDVDKKLSLWENSLEPWHEFLKHVKNLGTVPAASIQGLLNFVPEIIQAVFTHCKRSESFYGRRFNDLLPQLTSLFRRTSGLLDSFFAILENNVEFEQEVKEVAHSLNTVLDKVGAIAVLTSGMDLKTQINTWKAFAKLAATHEIILKKFNSTTCITRRYIDVAKDVEVFILDSLKDNKEKNYERGIKCAAMLLKILVRLCTLYRGYCGNKVFIVLVQLLAKLHRYLPPLTAERFIHAHSKICECLATHIVPTMGELLSVIIDENEFREAFVEYGTSELDDPTCFHLLTLGIMEELCKRLMPALSPWMQDNTNIIDVALANANYCCNDFLKDTLCITMRTEPGSRHSEHLGLYHTTLRLLCQLIARTSAEDFPMIEIALLKHLLSGEFWSSLLSCDTWKYLARIAPPDVRIEHLSFLIKVQKSLTARGNSLEFGMLSSLIRRLYKLLPDGKSFSSEDPKFTLFREIEDYSDRRLLEPFRGSLPPRALQYLLQQLPIDRRNDVATIFQELRRSPSVKNWTRLTSLLNSIGAVADSKDERLDLMTLSTIWSFTAESVPKSTGITREMLLELITLLFDCMQLDREKSSNHERLTASIYMSIAEIMEYLPTQHRIRMNIFLRENLSLFAGTTGRQDLSAITELFCSLLSDENLWVRQVSFETYAEHILDYPSPELFDSLSVGMSKLYRVAQQITSYLSNIQIHALKHYSSLDNYLRDLAEFSRDRSTRLQCFEEDFQTRDEKKPRLEDNSLNDRICDICDELENIVERKNDLSSDCADRLRMVLIKLLEN